MPGPRNISEIPMQHDIVVVGQDGQKRTHNTPLDPQLRRVLSDMREEILQLRKRLTIPDPPTNFQITAKAFSNLVQWTRSGDADYYEVLAAPSASLLDANLRTIHVGNSAQYVDDLGQVGIKVFYWVRARKNTGASSLEIGPVPATTLGSAAGITSPPPPPPSNILVKDANTGRIIPYTLTNPRSFRL